ncbi:glycoside hydrolase [Podospora fimiseda]|uniref:lytic cellulose monooxygenase (C4-dehydrogenating) n=1 Tax=Podospora fimiseda TaxID=252190 RepID=A0AAN6YL18_9PEZI|nr:glycoside hydrolase [Podospora fimiseda]
MLSSLTTFAMMALTASAHYTFPKVNGGGDWSVVRRADNFQSNGFVENIQGPQIRCFQKSHSGASQTLNVTAGSTVTYYSNQGVFHPGPMQFYLARVPDGQSVQNWQGEGAVWFKIYHEQPGFGQQLTWSSNGKSSFPVKIPSCIRSGYYLLRAEHIALHSAGQTGGAQFYVSCAQLGITGGGNSEPPQKVSFPGAYDPNHPGIRININWPIPTSYQNPGPSVFQC